MRPSDEILRRIKKLESEVARLNRSPRLGSTAQEGGTQRLVTEDAAVALFEFGQFVDPLADDRYGLALRDGDGVPVVVVDELQRGAVYPCDHGGWSHAAAATNVTSAAFIDIATTIINLPHADTIIASGRIVTPATTTAEVRIWDTVALGVGGGTDPVVVPANSDGYVTFVWLHPYTVGWDADEVGGIASAGRLRWQVRRASGAGAINAYDPEEFVMCSSRGAPTAAANGGGSFI